MDPEAPEQPRSYSPPPGWHQIHGLPDPRQLTQTTSDLDVYAPPKTRVQIKEPIPAGATVTLKGNPHVKLRPNDGPMGFGYYRKSYEDPSIVNYHPVIGLAEHLQAQPHGRRSHPGRSRYSMAPPPRRPPPRFNSGSLGGCQGGDPWMLQKEDEEDARQTAIQSGKVPPGQSTPQPPPSMLTSGYEETDPWVLNPPPEFKYPGFKGMSKETYAEMMKPVVPWDECTAWRKDPSYKARKREEQRKADREEFKLRMKACGGSWNLYNSLYGRR